MKMRMLDEVRVVSDNYENEGITRGMTGIIIDAEVVWESFFVCFYDKRVQDKEFMKDEENIYQLKDDICTSIKIKDLELVKDNGMTDEDLYRNLLENNKEFWCKVEDGFIMNLKGEKKNKIAYDYDS